MTSIPDLPGMVPGMEAGQIQGGSWAVSARGFNDQYANKLLVLVDGRSAYSPTYSGVFWDRQDTLLEDIERIEVIRGPGVGAYTRVDARLGYRPRSDIDMSFTCQNLQCGGHTEFVSVGPYIRATIGRSFLVKLTWGF